MPAPATVDELLELVQKSGVAEEARLKTYMKKLAEQKAAPTEPGKLAGLLVRDGVLTYFQAEQLLQGKWKRFSVGKYKVLEKLGSGGMGQVFLCEHKLMRRRVAVKILPTAKADDEASLQRFYREARAVAAVDHPNIVRAYDIDQDENLHFLVMEYVDGTNFQDLIKKFGPLDPIRACHYIYGAAVGLQHAHEMGLVHRDIKPGNILIDRSGVVKILDMGLARFFHDVEDNLTKQYDENILGTADYLSPEQAEDSHTVDIRSDIYSLGATFYFLLTGSQPFPEGTIPQKLIWHRSRQPKAISAIRPDVPEAVAAVVAKMMAKKPEDRYQTPAELIAALAPWVATPISPPSEREMPQLSPAIAGGAAGGRVGTGGAPHHAGHATLSGSGPLTVVSANPGSGETLAPFPVPSSNGVWETLDDTPAVSGPATARDPGSARRLAGATPTNRSRRPLLFAGGGAVLLGLVAGAYFLFFNKKPDTGEGTQVTGPRRLVVSKSPGENSFTTLANALRAASPGDTVVIAIERVAEPVIRFDRKKDLTLESGLPDGKAAVVEYAGSGGIGSALLDLVNVETVKIRNLEFDGKGLAETGVVVSGTCPGLTLEGVSVRGVKKTGIHLHNVAGTDGKPVTLDRFRVQLTASNDAGILIEAGAPLETRRVVIHNGRIEGPGKAGIKFDGAVTDIEVAGNRLFRLDSAFVLARTPEGKLAKAHVAHNTVCEVNIGVDFPTPAELKGKLELTVTRNYFARTNVVGQAPEPPVPPPPAPPPPPISVPGVSGAENGFGPGSNPGNIPLSATPVAAPELPVPNPTDDATFLRFPAGTQPEVGPNKVRIGAN